jgi:hypothetical protein
MRHRERDDARRRLPTRPKARPLDQGDGDPFERHLPPEARSPAALALALRRFEAQARRFEAAGAWELAASLWQTFYRWQDHKERAVRRALGRL